MAGWVGRLAQRAERVVDPRRLWRLYVVGLAAILALLTVSHLLTHWAITSARGDAVVINESGRQRMLSQRILYFVARIENGDTRARGALSDAVDLFASAHEKLTSGDLSSESRALYFEPRRAGGASLDDLVLSFVRDARLILEAPTFDADSAAAFARMEAIGPDRLLNGLNAAVSQFEREAVAKSDWLTELKTYSLLAALLVLVLEALFIFLPADLAVRRAFRRLEAARRREKAKSKELAAQRAEAEHEALHDPLTKLANRRFLKSELTARAHARDGGVAVLHIDLDRFKEINDSFGHAAGDQVLRHVADTLRELVGPDDFVARLGGDEFVVVTPAARGRETVSRLAGAIVDRLSRPVAFEGSLCHFGASIGVDLRIDWSGDGPMNLERVLTNADVALYRAKERGRGRFEFFSEDLRARVTRTKSLAEELREALSEKRIEAHYQPQIDARTGRIVGVEALARWRRASDDLVSPYGFIGEAERLGVEAEIDAAVHAQVAADVADWVAAGVRAPTIALNLSGRRLHDPKLRRALAAQGRDLAIALELPERLLDCDDDVTQHSLDQLRELGAPIRIDDFGREGLALLALERFAPERVILDARLTRLDRLTAGRMAPIEAAVLMAKRWDISIAAKAVETAEAAEMLCDLGCEVLQGDFFASVMPAEEMAAYLAAEAETDAETVVSARPANL